MSRVERFAPSPTGLLHLGHAFSALLAHDAARAAGGRFLLRIEDIDTARARPDYEAAIFEDLAWLGLAWEQPVMRQSQRSAAYAAALSRLQGMGLLYRCTCTRADIRAALSAPQEGATGPDGPVYPGTCRDAAHTDPDAALRIDMRKAVARLDAPLTFGETDNPGGPSGPVTIPPVQLIEGVGDVILARKDIGTSYHLAVVVDDAEQGVTHVTRGQDLFEATAIHVLLQRLLGLPTPVYRHHRLIRDAAGKRLAKRDDARAIRTFRENGASPADIRRLAGL